jgi:hypothetical protein
LDSNLVAASDAAATAGMPPLSGLRTAFSERSGWRGEEFARVLRHARAFSPSFSSLPLDF